MGWSEVNSRKWSGRGAGRPVKAGAPGFRHKGPREGMMRDVFALRATGQAVRGSAGPTCIEGDQSTP
jgi:hypothetical protein